MAANNHRYRQLHVARHEVKRGMPEQSVTIPLRRGPEFPENLTLQPFVRIGSIDSSETFSVRRFIKNLSLTERTYEPYSPNRDPCVGDSRAGGCSPRVEFYSRRAHRTAISHALRRKEEELPHRFIRRKICSSQSCVQDEWGRNL